MLPLQYDSEGAAKKLDDITGQRRDSYLEGLLSDFAKDSECKAILAVKPATTRFNTLWRLTRQTGDEDEEYVFTIQGIIAGHDLPPINNPYKRDVKTKNLAQRVKISGLGSETFSVAIHGFQRIDQFLRRNVRESDEQGTDVVVEYGEHIALEVSNRYFSNRDQALKSEACPFSDDVDPKGYLKSLEGKGYFHTMENTVRYFERHVNNIGSQSFNQISPARFRNGDIVELQITIMLAEIRLKGPKGSSRYDTFTERAKIYATPYIRTTGMKRKIGYEAEQERETQGKMRKMVIDNDTNHIQT
ncbi:hypothetical protein MPER_13193 [Moniliophthora perniciosa FA553]|nr:hypothetical protein MPER_13193 [Moniliophthora perniciosa FA553]